MSLCLGGINEKDLLAEADYLKQIPPNDHIINYLLTFLSKGTSSKLQRWQKQEGWVYYECSIRICDCFMTSQFIILEVL